MLIMPKKMQINAHFHPCCYASIRSWLHEMSILVLRPLVLVLLSHFCPGSRMFVTWPCPNSPTNRMPVAKQILHVSREGKALQNLKWRNHVLKRKPLSRTQPCDFCTSLFMPTFPPLPSVGTLTVIFQDFPLSFFENKTNEQQEPNEMQHVELDITKQADWLMEAEHSWWQAGPEMS